MFQNAIDCRASDDAVTALVNPQELYALMAERRRGRAQLVFQRLPRAEQLCVLRELPRKDALCLLRRLPNQAILELLRALPADWSRDFRHRLPVRKRVAVNALQTWSDEHSG